MLFARVSRLVLAALVVGGTLATPEEVCARHQGHEVGTPAPAHPSHHDSHPEKRDAPTAPPCERQTLAECCPMLMACSFAFADDGRTEGIVTDGEHGAPPRGRSAGHLFRPTTPDPPPPKA
jgi:hypothetical protein